MAVRTAVGDAQMRPSSPWPMLYDEKFRSPLKPSGDIGRSGRLPAGFRCAPSGEANLGLKAWMDFVEFLQRSKPIDT